VVRDGTLLLIRRAKEPQRGRWEVPGGFCEATEHPMETAAREVFEEIGLRVRVGEILGMWLDTYGDEDPPEASLGIYFLAEPIDRSAVPRPTEEASEVGWFLAGEIPSELAFPAKLVPALEAWGQHAEQRGATDQR
jgi:ADP-ribose pyrophosphatase YjhB (NUDIX family)